MRRLPLRASELISRLILEILPIVCLTLPGPQQGCIHYHTTTCRSFQDFSCDSILGMPIMRYFQFSSSSSFKRLIWKSRAKAHHKYSHGPLSKTYRRYTVFAGPLRALSGRKPGKDPEYSANGKPTKRWAAIQRLARLVYSKAYSRGTCFVSGEKLYRLCPW